MTQITITEQEYLDLIQCRKELRALEGAGVDNWEGYGDAMLELQEKEADQD